MVLEPENPAEVKNVAIITAYRDLQKSPLEAGDNVLTAASSLSYPRQSTAGIIGNWDPENIIADAPINRGGGGGGLFDLNGHLIGIAQSPPHLIKGQVQPNQLQLKSMYQGSDVVQYNTYPTTRFRDGGGRFVPIATIQRNLAEMGLTLQLMPAAATDGGRP